MDLPILKDPELPDNPSIKMVSLRVGALVVFCGQVVPVVNRRREPEGMVYRIHTKDRQRGLRQHEHVTLGQLMAELNEHARWCVGDRIELGAHVVLVLGRWWNCREGAVFYRINSPESRKADRIVRERTLVDRLEMVQVRHLE